MALALVATALLSSVVPAGLGGVGVADARSCAPSEQDISTGGDRLAGTQDAPGALDAQWQVFYNSNTVKAHSIVGLVPPWVQDPNTANWVNPWGPTYTAPGDNALPGGTWDAPHISYYYWVAFNLDFGQYDRATLDFRFAADDVAEIRLNPAVSRDAIATAGVLTTTAGFSQWHPVSYGEDYASKVRFVNGVNVLYIRVTNWILYTGLVVDGVVRQSCDSAPCEEQTAHGDLNTGRSLVLTQIHLPGAEGTDNTAPGPTLLVPDPPGTRETRWYMEEVAGVATPLHPRPYTLATPTYWVNSLEASWVNPYGSGMGTIPDGPAGDYQYTIEFQLPCMPENCGQLTMDLNFAADNDVQLFLNDVPITPPVLSAFSSLHQLAITGCQPFQVGLNTLTAEVHNLGGPTGLLVAGEFDLRP